MTWQGATRIVNIRRAVFWGPWYVAEQRLRNMSKWMVSLISFGLGNPILFLFAIGLGVGSLVDANAGGRAIDGVGYLTFLAPALLAGAAIQAAMDETSFPTLQGFLWEKNFYAMNATHLGARSIVNGVLIASMIRAALTTVLYEAVLLVFGAITWASVLPLFISAMLAGAAFAAAMLATASKVVDDDGFFAIIGRFVIAPMMLFSGTYFPINTLPIYLQPIGWISPVWHATNLGRVLSYGLPIEPWLFAIHVAYLSAMFIGGSFMATRIFAKRLDS
ncbi:MAG: hypothetical protein RLY88_667 [Actinomycetota bacterium]|jgi:lipooligosaccharide transport system permease protein